MDLEGDDSRGPSPDPDGNALPDFVTGDPKAPNDEAVNQLPAVAHAPRSQAASAWHHGLRNKIRLRMNRKLLKGGNAVADAPSKALENAIKKKATVTLCNKHQEQRI